MLRIDLGQKLLIKTFWVICGNPTTDIQSLEFRDGLGNLIRSARTPVCNQVEWGNPSSLWSPDDRLSQDPVSRRYPRTRIRSSYGKDWFAQTAQYASNVLAVGAIGSLSSLLKARVTLEEQSH
ncbi:hypothetical protein OOU_Y34scaffold00311g3 [Pyricularia oryzae Y34]|uniref:Uncharacterized protein n=1 Tax=Pyricularia oryzae (strain Y34) TaxID=1143189 RepID=A0AA97P3D9_PYRO3|nr:hypothetical protein OOU_Y34scaffold00311g3 [Pyricularia oryzae Y34]